MSVAISGMGWATPLGTDLESVWARLLEGERPELARAADPHTGESYPYYAVPMEWVEAVGRNRRLRRSSAITYFTASAGLAALADAGLEVTPELAGRTAVVFAVSSGGVAYTRRFYQQIVEEGANAASPLLFPETVYNAPASHLAATLGLDGMSYTLVGDGSVGLSGVNFGAQLLETDPALDHVVVVGGEEIDWILCAAYRDWRLATGGRAMELYGQPALGTILGEGGAAVVLGRGDGIPLGATHPGASFFSRATAAGALTQVLGDLGGGEAPDLAVGSANGTFIDAAEKEAVSEAFGGIGIWSPKPCFGEALGAGALLQVVAAGMAIRTGKRPGGGPSVRRTLVPVIGLSQQVGALILGGAS